MTVPKKYPILIYVIAVVIVWVVILSIVWFTGSPVHFNTLLIFCGGFFIGMFAMWIAAHLYKI